MLTDYKFWYIKRSDNGFIEEATIRFYEGDLQVVQKTRLGVTSSVISYVRSKRLDIVDPRFGLHHTQYGVPGFVYERWENS